MKKIVALILTIAIVCTCLFALTACDNECKHVDSNGDGICDKCGEVMENYEGSLEGTYDITMWVSESVAKDADGNQVDSVVDMTKRQIAKFQEANPGIVINARIEGVTEADAGSKVVADVASAPDIYCFAQDQLARLVQAAALAAPGRSSQTVINEGNDAAAVKSGKVAGVLYAYPMTSDNGYYLYYDTSVVSNPDSLESIIEDCNKAGKKFRFALENAWYTASFFFATDCHSNWTTDEAGEFTSVDDDFNSDKGLIAMKGMQKLTQAECYDSNADIFTDCAAIVTGAWNSSTATLYFGENLGATDLPSFTVDGNEYHLGSYSGNKLMGVKPQTDAKRGAVLQLLAQYLTNEECQLERFNTFGWGPSNVDAQENEDVKADPSLSALLKQNENAIPQPQIHGSWWDIAKVLGAEAKAAKDDGALQNALNNYKNSIDALFTMSEEERTAYTIIGHLADTDWDTDLAMTPNEDKSVWTSKNAYELNAGDEFKIRQGKSWARAWGDNASNSDSSVPVSNKSNYKVETAGKYYIVLTITDGIGKITLEPAE